MCTACGQMQRNDQTRVQQTKQAPQFAPNAPKPNPVVMNSNDNSSVQYIRNRRDRAIQDAKRQSFHQNKLGGG